MIFLVRREGELGHGEIGWGIKVKEQRGIADGWYVNSTSIRITRGVPSNNSKFSLTLGRPQLPGFIFLSAVGRSFLSAVRR
jgi:hypothetical protein